MRFLCRIPNILRATSLGKRTSNEAESAAHPRRSHDENPSLSIKRSARTTPRRAKAKQYRNRAKQQSRNRFSWPSGTFNNGLGCCECAYAGSTVAGLLGNGQREGRFDAAIRTGIDAVHRTIEGGFGGKRKVARRNG